MVRCLFCGAASGKFVFLLPERIVKILFSVAMNGGV